MKIEFNPSDPAEMEMVHRMLGTVTMEYTPAELPDPLVDAGAAPPPPPPGAPVDNQGPDFPDGPESEGFAPGYEERTNAEFGNDDFTDPRDLDAAGVPWDERIHSGGRTKNKDGSWKRKRGVEDNEYQRVVAEITAPPQPEAVAPEPSAGAVPPPPSTGGPADDGNDGSGQQVSVPPAPPAPPAGHANAQPDNATAAFGGESANQWQDLVQKIMMAKVGEKVTSEELDTEAANLGVTGGFLNMISRPDLYATFEMVLVEKGVL